MKATSASSFVAYTTCTRTPREEPTKITRQQPIILSSLLGGNTFANRLLLLSAKLFSPQKNTAGAAPSTTEANRGKNSPATNHPDTCVGCGNATNYVLCSQRNCFSTTTMEQQRRKHVRIPKRTSKEPTALIAPQTTAVVSRKARKLSRAQKETHRKHHTSRCVNSTLYTGAQNRKQNKTKKETHSNPTRLARNTIPTEHDSHGTQKQKNP